MKICMIGLGSIGKRHLRNLVIILKRRRIEYQIDALRSGHTELPDEWNDRISRQYYDIDEMPNDYNIIFVTNPTALHYETIEKTLQKTDHMFIEKPIFESINHDIDVLPLREKSIYYVACPLRHKSIIKYVKKSMIKNEKVLSVRIISSSFLPSWRKDVDYRKVYSASERMGGGVTKDLIHEWDYAKYLFGIPDKVFHIKGHISDLKIDSDDISVYIAKYPGMILEMHLDYIGHRTERMLQLFTNKNRIDVDLISDTVYKYADNKLIDKQQFQMEDFYMNEMEWFFDCIEGKQENFNTITDAFDTLRIALTGGAGQ